MSRRELPIDHEADERRRHRARQVTDQGDDADADDAVRLEPVDAEREENDQAAKAVRIFEIAIRPRFGVLKSIARARLTILSFRIALCTIAGE